LDGSTRTQYAEKFFRRRTFTLQEENPPHTEEVSNWMMRWLASVSAEHRGFIGRIFHDSPPTHGSSRAWRQYQILATVSMNTVEGLYGKGVAEKIHCSFPGHAGRRAYY
jgi:hypothetical protein